MSNTWLVVGLGNPGPDYSHTRHNIGFMVAEELASRIGASFKSNKSRALVAEGRLGMGGPKLVLAKPQTFMNLSGGPTSALAKFYDLGADNVIAVQDEIDIPFNTIKLKIGGGEGGHNGLRDISKALGAKEYLRVRVGVGRPPGGQGDAAGHVLKVFSTAEKKELPFLIQDAADAVELLISDGLLAAQQKFHPAK
ncbi:peptidyl-tRNA hydrolase [Renibacterium salmoninarum ATCC 33209]|uniref:Peptidyl-tRNA hydrolase n=1 Tax=Renibacterium salmoninarum (strain ATCC 33209 / DSM 20767 / JCM 11484 / NBRC 15589 / NCIMB 2235) TaxID=288705 RepID=PTH_RENSM|nr:aminoacyl-tRNA hydrolase [Renibacterium salmoninarum]A9WU36.1 RecName: Full=Peptidyl-tRNA hydrolase; Short=PTH [Renibacterium salmoninarum ATCC 33209]ABY24707.1 peptidyl-tRNA hydrolase [Renibacterium salmoninarum ATCC 33209]